MTSNENINSMKDKIFELELGTKCNSHCIYCEQGNNPLNRDYSLVPFQQVKKILQESINKGFSQLYLQGGEPTIHPQVIDIVKYAKEIGFEKVDIITNGRLFNYMEFTKQIAEAGLDDITFSIQGNTSSIHNFITQSPGSFDQAIRGIKNLKSIKHSGNIQSSTVIIRQNYKNLSQIISLLQPLGIKIFHFIYVIPYDSVITNNRRVLIELSEVSMHLKEMLKVAKKKQLQAVVENIPFCMLQGYENHITKSILLGTLKLNQKSVIDKNKVGAKDWIKMQVCNSCKYYPDCKGLHRNYLKEFGDKEITPVS